MVKQIAANIAKEHNFEKTNTYTGLQELSYESHNIVFIKEKSKR